MWTSEKPTGPCACAYERDGVVFIGRVVELTSGLGFCAVGPIFRTMDEPVNDMPGRWLILDIPDPPKRMKPGEFVEAKFDEAFPQCSTLFATQALRHVLNEAVTAAIAAARRGELLINEVSE